MLALSQRTQKKLKRVQWRINQLPAEERPSWLRMLRDKMRGPTVSSGDGSETEWDLQFANWLDGVYTIVSDRVEAVAAKGAGVVRDAGWSLWPLALAAVALAWAFTASKRAASSSGE